MSEATVTRPDVKLPAGTQFIDGVLDTGGGETVPVIYPASGETFAEIRWSDWPTSNGRLPPPRAVSTPGASPRRPRAPAS